MILLGNAVPRTPQFGAVRDPRGRMPQLVSLGFQLVVPRPAVDHLARDPRSLGEHRNKHLSIRKTGEAALPRQGSRALAARSSLHFFSYLPLHLSTSPPPHLSTSRPPHLSTSLPGKPSPVALTPCSTTSNTCSWIGSLFGFKNLRRAFIQVGPVAFQVQIFIHYSAPKFQEKVHAIHVPETRSTSMKLDVTFLRALRGEHRGELRPFFD